MSDGDAAVLVMARAPRRGEVRRALEPLLGADGCRALQSALIAQTAAWAHAVAPGALYAAHAPPDAREEVRALVPPDATLFPQNGDGIGARIADAAARVFSRHRGPLLIVWPDLPRLRPAHASAALGDLAAGCDLVLGPAIDGGFYLIGIPRPLPELFTILEQAWRSPDVVAMGLAAARESGLEVGILRAERPLQRPSDVRAALADPTTTPEIARILTPRGNHGP